MSCTAFGILTIALAVLGLYHLYLFCYDAYYHFIKKSTMQNPRIKQAIMRFENNVSTRNLSANSPKAGKSVKPKEKVDPAQLKGLKKLKYYYKRFKIWVFKFYYPDSKWKIASMIFRWVYSSYCQSMVCFITYFFLFVPIRRLPL